MSHTAETSPTSSTSPEPAAGSPRRRFRMRGTTSRVRTALAGMALLSFLLGSPSLWWVLLAIVLALGIFGVREYHTMAGLTGAHGSLALAIAATVAVILFGLLPAAQFGRAVVPLLYFYLILVAIVQMRRQGAADAFRSMPVAFYGPFYVGVPLALALQIMQADRMFLLFGLLSVWMADTGGYVAGKKFGRTKLAPTLSPKKTVEGLIGGVVFSVGVAVIYKWAAPEVAFPYGWGTVLGLSAFLALLSPVGDLAESVLKRDAGVKDSGKTGTGHGGVLDRIDSLLFCTAVLYGYLVWRGTL